MEGEVGIGRGVTLPEGGWGLSVFRYFSGNNPTKRRQSNGAAENAEFLYENESYLIRGACFEAYKEMGPGFLEAVYQDCLAKEFTRQNIPFVSQGAWGHPFNCC